MNPRGVSGHHERLEFFRGGDLSLSDENDLISLFEGKIGSDGKAIINDEIGAGFDLIHKMEKGGRGLEGHLFFVHLDSKGERRFFFHGDEINGIGCELSTLASSERKSRLPWMLHLGNPFLISVIRGFRMFRETLRFSLTLRGIDVMNLPFLSS
jgi:hypothetical protein